MYYVPAKIAVRLSYDQYASLYRLIKTYQDCGMLDDYTLESVVIQEYINTQSEKQLQFFFQHDRRKVYAVKFSPSFALAVHSWMETVHVDPWQQEVKTALSIQLENHGLLKPKHYEHQRQLTMAR